MSNLDYQKYIKRKKGLHNVFNENEALCAYILSKSYDYPLYLDRKTRMRECDDIADTLNQLWHEGKKVITPNHVKSLLMHCYQNNLHLTDFIAS